MKNHARVALMLAILFCRNGFTDAAESSGEDQYQQWVDYRNGKISIAFDQTPVRFALHVIHAKTGFQIVIPSSSEAKLVNLKLDQQPFEPAIRSFISTMGYKNFALMYDQDGRPHRAVVLGAHPVIDANSASEAPVEPLTVEEREKLQTDLKRWSELKQEERGRIEDRLKNLPPSDDREELVKEFGRQVLAARN